MAGGGCAFVVGRGEKKNQEGPPPDPARHQNTTLQLEGRFLQRDLEWKGKKKGGVAESQLEKGGVHLIQRGRTERKRWWMDKGGE